MSWKAIFGLAISSISIIVMLVMFSYAANSIFQEEEKVLEVFGLGEMNDYDFVYFYYSENMGRRYQLMAGDRMNYVNGRVYTIRCDFKIDPGHEMWDDMPDLQLIDSCVWRDCLIEME